MLGPEWVVLLRISASLTHAGLDVGPSLHHELLKRFRMVSELQNGDDSGSDSRFNLQHSLFHLHLLIPLFSKRYAAPREPPNVARFVKTGRKLQNLVRSGSRPPCTQLTGRLENLTIG